MSLTPTTDSNKLLAMPVPNVLLVALLETDDDSVTTFVNTVNEGWSMDYSIGNVALGVDDNRVLELFDQFIEEWASNRDELDTLSAILNYAEYETWQELLALCIECKTVYADIAGSLQSTIDIVKQASDIVDPNGKLQQDDPCGYNYAMGCYLDAQCTDGCMTPLQYKLADY